MKEKKGWNERSFAHHRAPPSIQSLLSEVYAFELSLKNDPDDQKQISERSSMSYLNHGSFGDPYPSTLKLRQFYTDLCYRNPMVYHRSLVPILVQRSKARLCDYLKIVKQRDGVVFAPISSSLFQVLASVNLREGDVILTTDTIYHSLVDAISHLVAEKQLRWVKVETSIGSNSHEIFYNFQAAVKREVAAGNTIKLAVFDHISSKPTVLYPINSICQMCHELHIPTLVDGAHVPGALPSHAILVEDTMATFYAFTLHKWINVPRGGASGGLWVNKKDIQSRYSSFIDMSKLVIQGGWVEDNCDTTNMYLDASKPGYLTDHLTQGIYDESTREYENILVLPHCLELVLENEAQFQKHAGALKEYAVSSLAVAWALPYNEVHRWDTTTCEFGGSVVVPMLAIPLPTSKILAAARFTVSDLVISQQLKQLKHHLVLKLWTEYSIEVPIFVWKDQILGVRISFGRHVVVDDIRRLGDAVNRIIEQGLSLYRKHVFSISSKSLMILFSQWLPRYQYLIPGYYIPVYLYRPTTQLYTGICAPEPVFAL